MIEVVRGSRLGLLAARVMQEARMTRLERIGFERFTPQFARGSRVLIVGAGPSASAEAVTAAREGFDTTITLNSAWKVAPGAEVLSYEFAFRDPKIFEQQKNDFSWLDVTRVVFKPHALAMMRREDLAELVQQIRRGNRMRAPRFLPHSNVPGARVLDAGRPLCRSGRLPIQWKGSLSLWLDLCWLSGVKTIGLIGTDLGATGDDGRFIDHATNAGHEGISILGILEKLRREGYLDGIAFVHFHRNDGLRALLAD